MDLGNHTDSQLRALLHKYGLRVTEPLLARRIVVCEGPSDAVVLSRLIELRYGVTPDQLDLVMVAAGGAQNVVEIVHFLDGLGADWRAVLDWDAIFDRNPPQTQDGLTEEDRQAAEEGVDALLATLVQDNRNRRLKKTLRKLKRELGGDRPTPRLYEGSKLAKLLEGAQTHSTLTQADRTKLIGGLSQEQVTVYGGVLKRYGVWLWQTDLEHEMMRRDGAADVVELVLQEAEVLSGPVRPREQRVDRLANTLHNRAEDPILLQRIVDQLDKENRFSYQPINKAIKFLVDGLV